MSDPRRDAFIILKRVEVAGAYASVLLEAHGKTLSDRRDSALLRELVLGVLRHRAKLDHALAGVASRPLESIERSVLVALRLGAYSLLCLDRVPDFAAVDTSVELVKGDGHPAAAGFVNGVLRALASEGRRLLPAAPEVGDVDRLALFHSHPSWWTRRVVDRLGWARAESLLRSNNEPAPTVLAPWPPAGTSEDLDSRLLSEGIVTETGAFVPTARRVLSGVAPSTAAFYDGLFWIQDEASQLATSLFGATVGPRVADLCAAPGGKTLGLAARLPPGAILSADRNPKRLRRLRANLARLHVRDVLPLAADFGGTAIAVEGPFDDVLVDAPCSGTGTLRRHPEIRWRLTPDDLPALAIRQGRLLDNAAALVGPGGRIVYSVCSIEPEEGEDVAAAFLERHPEFSAQDPRQGLPLPARALVGEDLALRTTTAGHGLDGFYAVLLVSHRS